MMIVAARDIRPCRLHLALHAEHATVLSGLKLEARGSQQLWQPATGICVGCK